MGEQHFHSDKGSNVCVGVKVRMALIPHVHFQLTLVEPIPHHSASPSGLWVGKDSAPLFHKAPCWALWMLAPNLLLPGKQTAERC